MSKWFAEPGSRGTRPEAGSNRTASAVQPHFVSQEVAGFGINVTLVEPGGFSTDWSGPSASRSEELAEYADVRKAAASRPSANDPSDPTATRGAILKVVDAENPPLRIFFGTAPLDIATKDYESRLATWNEWQPVSIEAHGN